VSEFLERQRKFFLKLALTITLAENEIHNRRKDLRWYDHTAGIVKDGISEELIKHFDETVIKRYGLIKQSGCPFAKSKAFKKNALIEIFEYYDSMMIHMLSRASEFKQLFCTPSNACR